MRPLAETTMQLRGAGLQHEADALPVELPLLEPNSYGANAANRKRLHVASTP